MENSIHVLTRVYIVWTASNQEEARVQPISKKNKAQMSAIAARSQAKSPGEMEWMVFGSGASGSSGLGAALRAVGSVRMITALVELERVLGFTPREHHHHHTLAAELAETVATTAVATTKASGSGAGEVVTEGGGIVVDEKRGVIAASVASCEHETVRTIAAHGLEATSFSNHKTRDALCVSLVNAALSTSTTPNNIKATIIPLVSSSSPSSVSELTIESDERTDFSVRARLNRLIRAEIPTLCWVGGRRLSHAVDTTGWALLSGSYNPLHHGHRSLAEAAARDVETERVAFELSVVNADKAPVDDVKELERRVVQFGRDDAPLVLTSEALFVDKARATHAAAFVVGVDTASRILNEKYYDGSREKMVKTLIEVNTRENVRVLVAGRIENPAEGTGAFVTLRELDVPLELQHMFVEIPEQLFRADISSSLLRAQAVTAAAHSEHKKNSKTNSFEVD
eukprot:CAMPEP_0185857056 /NCGR_PEP_ID=MMETSP1354-20130828/29312_1 /TAXON_ID=708628 /ORGANISM="Erythrolobus madagascarensis, Strain CCMP3276" /LENGTH=455 /DNA_ID=CAMNT_0028559319 /DNA_START=45 /DNA_END=1411 /DNA_ORIENTATION=-